MCDIEWVSAAIFSYKPSLIAAMPKANLTTCCVLWCNYISLPLSWDLRISSVKFLQEWLLTWAKTIYKIVAIQRGHTVLCALGLKKIWQIVREHFTPETVNIEAWRMADSKAVELKWCGGEDAFWWFFVVSLYFQPLWVSIFKLMSIHIYLKQAGACGRRPGQFPRGGGRGCLSPSTGHI